MQNKTSVFDKKKVVTRFDKKIATWRKKSIDEEEALRRLSYCGPWRRRPYF